MDIPRKQNKTKRLIRRILWTSIGLGTLAAVTMGLSRLEPASPGVERETLLIDKVKQGNMVLEVRGVGTLVSEDMLIVPAIVSGRVIRRVIEPGCAVEPNTVILELSNPELELQWLDAQSNLNSARARYNAQKARLQDQILDMEASLARSHASLHEARLRAKVDQQQYDDGLISDLKMELTKGTVEELEKLLDIQQKRVKVFQEQTMPAQLEEMEAAVKQAQSHYNLKQSQMDALQVKADVSGVLAPIRVRIEPGQQVTTGQILARITDPKRLKAELQIPQGQAQDILIGMPAEIDTYNGMISGKVTRIEPTVMEGNVTVDVSLEGELPKGARPDFSVVGTIRIDHLVDILYVGRPVMAAEDSRTELFKVTPDGRFAERMGVRFGKTSVSTIEILEGLAVGDEIILSDVSQWDTVDKIRLK